MTITPTTTRNVIETQDSEENSQSMTDDDDPSTAHTETLIAEMLGFLENSSDDDYKENENLEKDEIKTELVLTEITNDEDDSSVGIEKEEDAVAVLEGDEPIVEVTNTADGNVEQPKIDIDVISKEEQKKVIDNYVMDVLKKIIEDYPSWNYKLSEEKTETTACANAATDSPRAPINTNVIVDPNFIYINEVKRALHADPTGHPPKESPEYYKAAERYALYGKDFDDFPQDFSTLYDSKNFQLPLSDSSILGDGLYPTPTAAELASSLASSNYGKPYGVSTFAGTTYYHHLGLQQNWRQTVSAGSSSAIGMYLGNKPGLAYMPSATTPTQLVYNQHTANTSNFIANSLANAALASSPLIYSNPLLPNSAQNYLHPWYQKNPYMNNQIVPNAAAAAAAMGFYERLLYAQVLQKQIYNYQTRAVAMAAMYQQQQQHQHQQTHHNSYHYRPRLTRSTTGGFTGTAPTFYTNQSTNTVVTNDSTSDIKQTMTPNSSDSSSNSSSPEKDKSVTTETPTSPTTE